MQSTGINSALDTSRKKQAKKLSTGRIAFLIHSYVGLKLSLIFCLVLLSGTIAVFHEEIDWLLYEEKRAIPVGDKMNPGEVFDRLQAQLPDAGIAQFATAMNRERTAATAIKSTENGNFTVVHINPYTGEYQGETNFLTVGRFLRILHTNLFMPLIGRAFVNFFGILCLIGLITGLFAYRRFWKKFFTLPKYRGVKFHRFLADLHKFVGLWSLWFVLIIGVSGTWWFYHNPLVQYNLAPAILSPQPMEPSLSHQDLVSVDGQKPKRLSSAEIVTAVLSHDPNFEISALKPPEHNGMAYSVKGTKHDLLTSPWDNTYYVHPFTGDIIGSLLMEDADLLHRFDRSMTPLHYGTFGHSGASDLIVKSIWFVFGLAMTLLSISGTIIYYKRTKSEATRLLKTASTRNQKRLKKAWLIVRPWGGPMSGFKYLNWAFLLVMAIGISIAFKLQREGVAGGGFQYQAQRIGSWEVQLNAVMGLLEKDLNPIRPGRTTTVNAYINGDTSEIKFMYVSAKKPRGFRAPGFVIHGVNGNRHAHMAVPDTLVPDNKLWLTIEDWNGHFYQTSWPLLPDGVSTIDKRVTKIN